MTSSTTRTSVRRALPTLVTLKVIFIVDPSATATPGATGAD